MLTCNFRRPLATQVLVLLVLSCFVSIGTTALRHRSRNDPQQQGSLQDLSLLPVSVMHHIPILQLTATSRSAWTQMRGGAFETNNGDHVELNPEYHSYVVPPVPPQPHNTFRHENEHQAWLRQQNQQSTTFVYGGPTGQPSLLERTRDYLTTLHTLSPSLFWTTLSCVGIFMLWQFPALTPHWSYHSILYQWCINNRANCKKTWGLSLILSSFSHISPYHLLVNLLSFSQLGPNVKMLLSQYQTSHQRLRFLRHNNNNNIQTLLLTLWPLLLSSAVVSNGLFLVASPRGASSLGLSGVTMTLLALLARAYPDRRYGMVVGVIPISLSAQQLLQALLLLSILGAWSSSSSSMRPFHRLGNNQNSNPIAHLVHLGGLLYGMLYYEMVLLRLTPLQILQKMLRYVFYSK